MDKKKKLTHTPIHLSTHTHNTQRTHLHIHTHNTLTHTHTLTRTHTHTIYSKINGWQYKWDRHLTKHNTHKNKTKKTCTPYRNRK